MHNEHKFITQDEKALCQVLLESFEASGKLDTVFSCHSESGPNTFSERNRSNESGTVSRVVFILFLELLTRRVMG